MMHFFAIVPVVSGFVLKPLEKIKRKTNLCAGFDMISLRAALAAIPLVLISMVSSHAYGAFNPDGTYYCNSSNLPLEETIYKSSVTKVDARVESYLSDNPSATDQEIHSYLVSNPAASEPYSIMEQSKACLESNGISPDSVASPSSLLLQVFAAPEFGAVSSMVFGVTLAGVVLVQNRINKSSLVRP